MTTEQALRDALSELFALVMGECRQLLDEDSGGDSALYMQIQEALALPTADHPNLSDPAVQKRLAAQWGYVPKTEAVRTINALIEADVVPTAATVDERAEFEREMKDAFEHENGANTFARHPHPHDVYVFYDVQHAWVAWQARASLQSVDDATTKEIPLLSDDEMPPLPEPVTIDTHESGYRIRGYTAEQMRDYARKAHP